LKTTNLPVRLKPQYIITGFSVIVLLFILLGSFCENKHNSDTDSTTYINCTPAIPAEVNFCGEPVPLSYFDVKESLEKELIVNSFWHSQTILFLKKAPRYFSEIEPILKENNIPEDFKYLMVAESGFQDIVSPAGAAGQWHFLEATAKEYGLEVNEEVDERYNLTKSTEAACKYFKESYTIYKNWTLVAASYNGGRRGVDRQVERQGETDYYNLLFAEETGRYVYRIIALKLILGNPDAYGFHLTKDEIYPLYDYKEIKVDSSITDMGNFAKSLGTNYKMLKMLNPWLRDKKLTNPKKKEYIIKVPSKGSRNKY
jgi:membrane-bound lytic murein transglycosylase D